MRWLMRSGDAERIATFALASRDRAAQSLAADYLRRRAAWRSRPDLARNVQLLYARARAHGKLAGFHAECAAMEIDDYEVCMLCGVHCVRTVRLTGRGRSGVGMSAFSYTKYNQK